MYRFLDYFFLVFHFALVVFNLFGWVFKKTRRLNLITLGLTFLAWFGLGIFYGIGYCPVTDWHWDVLHNLGQYNLPDSYISYILNRIFNLSVQESLVENLTGLLFFMAFGISGYLNFRDYKRKRKKPING